MPQFPIGSKWTLALALAAAAPAWAQTSAPPPAQFQALAACRGIADDARRLACYDTAAGQLAEAEARGEVLVVSREQARAARRQAFGFNLPTLSIFDRGADPDEAERLTATVRAAYRNSEGKWTVELEDGAVWAQTDNETLGRAPRQGSEARIRRAAMGGFFMNLDGQRAVRARRVK